MKSLYSLLVLVGCLAVLNSCGESFSARYGGNGRVYKDSCNDERVDAYMEVKLTISGDSAEIVLTKLVNAGTQQNVRASYTLSNFQAKANLHNDTNLDKLYQSKDDPAEADPRYLFVREYSVTGYVNKNRDEVTGLKIDIAGNQQSAPCEIGLLSDSLKIITE